MSKPGIFLIGSYNGQDSMGDKCLLRVVSSRFRRLLPDDVPIYFHAENTEELQPGGVLSDAAVIAQRGVQSYFWNWHTKLRHLHLPEALHRRVSVATFPLAARTYYRNDETLQEALRQLDSSAFMFTFGGTQFTKQWWRMNLVPYMLMTRMAELPVYFGTQQYGPMTEEQQQRTQAFIRERVEGVRFRNAACMPELGMEGEMEKLTRDEVFSNTQVYPVVEERSGQGADTKTILVNYRGEQNFLSEDREQARLDHLVAYLRALHNRLDCTFTLFSVSGPEFCDDTECFDYIRQNLPEAEVNELPYTNAYDHIEAAKEAYAAVSMSFHGVILSMIGGCPAIPITHGKYYNHKYIGFKEYNPDTPIPIFYVDEAPDQSLVEESVDYFETYNPVAVADERRRHNEKIELFYRGILEEQGLLEREKETAAAHG
jgi:polysaccharide pyruvyl transferase WcaK-like protein